MYVPSRVKTEEAHIEYVVDENDDDGWQDVDDWDPLQVELEDPINGMEMVDDMQPVVMLQKLEQEDLPRRRSHECEECHASYSSQRVLVEHMRSHAQANPFTCPFCPGLFRFQAGLLNHRCSAPGPDAAAMPPPPPPAAAPNKEKTFKCDQCDRRFHELKNLRMHRTMKHGKQPKVPDQLPRCRICYRQFENKGSLLVHATQHSETESEDGVYRCAVCPVEYPSKLSLRSHMRVHTTDKPHLCTKCPQRFTSRASLWEHLRTHGEVCSQCKQCFLSSEELAIHIKTEHSAAVKQPEAPRDPQSSGGGKTSWFMDRKISFTKPYKCWNCLRTFSTPKSLCSHRRYNCPYRNKSRNGTSLTKVRRHGKFRCGKCDERFMSRKTLWWHATRVHKAIKTESNPPEATATTSCDTQTHLQNVTEFPCSKCPEVFNDRRSLMCHHRSEHANDETVEAKFYNCSKCSESFPDRKTHFAHYKSAHSDGNQASPEGFEDSDSGVITPNVYHCGKCPEIFPDRKSHFSHYKLMHTNSEPVPETSYESDYTTESGVNNSNYTHCNKCTEIFPDRKSFSVHFRTTHGSSEPQEDGDEETAEVKGSRYHCGKCPAVFPDRKSHHVHYKMHLIGSDQGSEQSDTVYEESFEKKYQCSKCPLVFSGRKNHWRHYIQVHRNADAPAMFEEKIDTKGYHCSKCTEVFQDRKTHFAHYRTAHSGAESLPMKVEASDEMIDKAEKQYQCGKCDQVFPDRKSHSAHYKTSHSDFPAENGETDYTAIKQRQFHCSKCPQVFPDRKSHWHHYQMHSSLVAIETDPTPGNATVSRTKQAFKKSMRCSKCSKRFANRKVLWLHIQHHKHDPSAAVKTVKCKKCPEWFVDRVSLHEHMLAAHEKKDGTKLLRCSRCSSRFVSRSQLWLHARTHRITTKMYKCDDCGGEFNTRGDLRAHAEVHRTGPAGPGGALYDVPLAFGAVPYKPPKRRNTSIGELGEGTSTAAVKVERPYDPVQPTTGGVAGEEILPDAGAEPTAEETAMLVTAERGNVELPGGGHVETGEEATEQVKPAGSGEAGEVNQNAYLPGAGCQSQELPNGSKDEDIRNRAEGSSIAGNNLTPIARSKKKHFKRTKKLAALNQGGKLRIQCKKCDASFNTYLGFNSHQRVHVVSRPYKCKQCETTFTNGPNLLRHMRVHLGIKPYKCRHCSETFATVSTRRNHMIEMHPPAVIEG